MKKINLDLNIDYTELNYLDTSLKLNTLVDNKTFIDSLNSVGISLDNINNDTISVELKHQLLNILKRLGGDFENITVKNIVVNSNSFNITLNFNDKDFNIVIG